MRILFYFFISISTTVFSQQIAVLKYKGGGDWYANPTALPNLITFTNANCKTSISKNIATVNSDDEDIFNYPIIFMTGHGNVFFTEDDGEAVTRVPSFFTLKELLIFIGIFFDKRGSNVRG